MNETEPTAVHLRDYRPPAWLVDEVALVFNLEASQTRVLATLRCRRNPAAGESESPLALDGDELRLQGLRLNGEPLAAGDYRLDDTGLTLPDPPEAFSLEIETEIDPAANTKLEGLYLSSGVFCTQCEAEGFRRITFFPDRPDVMATYRTTIRADRTRVPVLLSNGNLVESGGLDGGRHYAVWDDPFPKPSYLFALVAGDLGHAEDRFTTRSGREVVLRIYVEHGNEDRTAYAMDALKRAMRWDEERYGFEYDLDLFNIVAVSDFNMGAMENKSLNVFNAKYVLADAETATDQDYAFIEAIVAHEYFHNWTGNRVTCRDWFQLSLKEGLTVFRDQQFSADMRSEPVQRIRDVRALRARQFPEDAGPLAHPVRPASYIEINNFYTATVYEKGAEVIRMLHRLLDEDGFQAGIRLYVERHDGEAVTCDDFVAAMADANGVELDQFKLWYSQAGTPEVGIDGRYDATAGSFELKLRQSTAPTPGETEKAALHLPLEVGLLDAAGNDLPLRLEGEDGDAGNSRVLELRQASQRFRFLGIETAPVLSINRGFTAPIKLSSPPNATTAAALMGGDGDPFNRWEAGQRLASQLLLDRIRASAEGLPPPDADTYTAAFARGLMGDGLDDAFRAELLGLPAEDYLAEQMEVIDVEAVHRARQELRLAIATELEAPLLETYRAKQSNAPYSPDAASAGRRAVRNRVLGYLVALETPEMLELAMAQYRGADNMTDRMAALVLLVDIDTPARAEALDDFYQRYQGDALVLDKWFQVQATSAPPDTLARVRELRDHPAFSLANPNRVRALIGAFAQGNPLRFHGRDGAGYAFLADQVLALDRSNPQVAARLVAPLGRWRRFGAPCSDDMRGELQRILAQNDLSNDVYEVASKSFA